MHAFAVRCSAVLASASLIFLTASASAQAHAVRHVPKHKVGRSTSTNWSGYAIDGSGATHVIGTWTQPKVSCAPGENSWSSPWVGIDGDNSNTVEQTGTDSDCNGGVATYYAWYEMYPKSLVQLAMTVAPGNSFTGEVTYNGNSTFTLRLTNNSTGVTYSTTQTSRKAKRSSVEWIMEGPSNGLLSDFGQVPFTATSATISGVTSSVTAASTITMVNNAGTVRAAPPLPNGAPGVTWYHG
jgi:hypothetical protein